MNQVKFLKTLDKHRIYLRFFPFENIKFLHELIFDNFIFKIYKHPIFRTIAPYLRRERQRSAHIPCCDPRGSVSG